MKIFLWGNVQSKTMKIFLRGNLQSKTMKICLQGNVQSQTMTICLWGNVQSTTIKICLCGNLQSKTAKICLYRVRQWRSVYRRMFRGRRSRSVYVGMVRTTFNIATFWPYLLFSYSSFVELFIFCLFLFFFQLNKDDVYSPTSLCCLDLKAHMASIGLHILNICRLLLGWREWLHAFLLISVICISNSLL